MDWTIAMALYYVTIPALLFYYYCRLLDRKAGWYAYVLYAAASFGLLLLESGGYISGYVCVLLQTVLLGALGVAFLRGKAAPALCVAALVYSVYSIIAGITQSLLHWIISELPQAAFGFMKYSDIAQHLLTAVLIILSFYFIVKLFEGRIAETYRFTFLLVGIPVFFIALVEKTVSTTIYGNTIVWNSEQGLVSPVVNNEEIIVLQMIAFAGLFCTLLAYKRLIAAFLQEHTITQLKQQANDQRVYVREAQSRYDQTRSFRHDIKNHLLVLRQLLAEEKTTEAAAYLANLESMSAALSYSVSTGNTVVDALLSSKLAMAAQQEVAVECALGLPQLSGVEDIEWCIILSNALDNAITACKAVPRGNRYIRLSHSQKGNFYMLCVENSCAEQTEPPAYGIGLSNIKSVAAKHGGDIEVDISGDMFRLNVLLVISQQ